MPDVLDERRFTGRLVDRENCSAVLASSKHAFAVGVDHSVRPIRHIDEPAIGMDVDGTDRLTTLERCRSSKQAPNLRFYGFSFHPFAHTCEAVPLTASRCTLMQPIPVKVIPATHHMTRNQVEVTTAKERALMTR